MRIAMIGAGGFANRHLQALRSIESTEVVAHVARTSGTAEAAAQRWGGTAYTGCESMLENEQPDAAWITVPPGSHGAIEESLIRAGLEIICDGVDIHVRQAAVSYDFGHELREERVKTDPAGAGRAPYSACAAGRRITCTNSSASM